MKITIDELHCSTIILGGGDYPSHPLPLRLLREAEHIVCCDGAVFELLRHGLKPWRIVGDCDTILTTPDPEERSMLEANLDIVRRYEGQDDNDQTKAVRYCLNHGMSELVIVGATGKREDHTLGNISLLMEYLKMGANVIMVTDHGIFIPCHDRLELNLNIPEEFVIEADTVATRKKSVQISVFNMGARDFCSEGLRYPLYDFTEWWQGTLNEATASPIRIQAKGYYLVYVCYD